MELEGSEEGQPYSDSLWTGLSGNRIPVAARLFAPVQVFPGAHSACYAMGTGIFQGVKRPGLGVKHLPQSSAEVEDREDLYLYSVRLHGRIQGEFLYYLYDYLEGGNWPPLRERDLCIS